MRPVRAVADAISESRSELLLRPRAGGEPVHTGRRSQVIRPDWVVDDVECCFIDIFFPLRSCGVLAFGILPGQPDWAVRMDFFLDPIHRCDEENTPFRSCRKIWFHVICKQIGVMLVCTYREQNAA
jgi:hypothetical protein